MHEGGSGTSAIPEDGGHNNLLYRFVVRTTSNIVVHLKHFANSENAI